MGISDISPRTFAYFRFTHVLTSTIHMRLYGGLSGEIINISKDPLLFLRDHIEAMLVLRSDECELAVFSNS